MNDSKAPLRKPDVEDRLARAISVLCGENSRLRMALDMAPPPLPARMRTGQFFERYKKWFSNARASALLIR